MEAARLIFQWLNLAGSIAIVVIAVLVGHRWHDARALVVFPALWGLFGFLYYAAVLSGRLPPDGVLLWGAAHRAMAVILVIGFLLALGAIMAAPYPLPGDDDDAE